MPALTTVGAVVLSMGNRPVELELALDTLLAQEGVDLDVVLVGNGWRPEGLPTACAPCTSRRTSASPRVATSAPARPSASILFFYDDDASLPSDRRRGPARAGVRARRAHRRGAAPRCRPDGRPTPRRWIPRLRTGGGGAPGDIVVFWEGVCPIRRSAFEEVGGWPGHFWYGHEGIDLAFRLLDAGWRLRYRPDVVVNHPATQPHATRSSTG